MFAADTLLLGAGYGIFVSRTEKGYEKAPPYGKGVLFIAFYFCRSLTSYQVRSDALCSSHSTGAALIL